MDISIGEGRCDLENFFGLCPEGLHGGQAACDRVCLESFMDILNGGIDHDAGAVQGTSRKLPFLLERSTAEFHQIFGILTLYEPEAVRDAYYR